MCFSREYMKQQIESHGGELNIMLDPNISTTEFIYPIGIDPVCLQWMWCNVVD